MQRDDSRLKVGATAMACTVALMMYSMSASAGGAKAKPAVPPPAITKRAKICVGLPRAQLGQGTTGVDVAEPVRQSLLAFLTGPGTELVPLQSRIAMQMDAEAKELGCEYVLTTSVTQKKGRGGGGFGKMMGALAPLAGALPGIGGMAGGAGSMIAAQAAAAAQSAAMQDMQRQAMEQISGATQSNIKKGDQLELEYVLTAPGAASPLAQKSATAKATENGTDILSPLIEQAATDILTAINTPPPAVQ